VNIANVDTEDEPGAPGDRRSVSARIDLGALKLADVAVEVVHGPLDADGSFVHPIAEPLAHTASTDGREVFTGTYQPQSAGVYGCTVRVIPHHADLATPMELGRITWAS
jgi:starch phosphorylase